MTAHSRKFLQTGGVFIAISMLSACGSIPRSGGEFVDTLGDVGAKTLELGGRAVASTKDFLNLEAEDGVRQTEALDGEIDMALMETESTLLDGDSEVVVGAASTNVVTMQPIERSDLAVQQDQALESEATLAAATPDPLALDPLANPDPLAPETSSAAASVQSVATSDLIHEVQSQENLWDIAKATTGDANNWHVLADINNLAPNASVFPGQELTIPADMIKPGYLKNLGDVETATVATPAAAVETASVDTKRLAIPEGDVQTDTAVADAAVTEISAGAQRFKVGPGETLWNFAKRTTGDATNWIPIAAQNNFSEKQATTVYPGQTVYVPTDLVKSIDGSVDNNTVASATAAKPAAATDTDKQTTEVAAAAPKLNDSDAEALEAAAAVLASNESILDDNAPIKIVEAKFQEEPAAEDIGAKTEELAAEAKQQLDTNAAQQIMISGTYYPKAIYNEADFSSTLLMRVSPGTQLPVSQAVGPWYQVMTEKGVGYVHTRDIR